MSLLNVRLAREDEEAVRVLKRSGVEISSVVREAIRREADRHRTRDASSTAQLLTDIFAAHPDVEDGAPPRADVHDRRAFAHAFRAHLTRPRRGRSRR